MKYLTCSALVAIALLLVSNTLAQTGGDASASSSASYNLTWHTVDNGGGRLDGGSYVLLGTAGQPEAGSALEGGNHRLVGGFWPGTGMAQYKLYLPLIIK